MELGVEVADEGVLVLQLLEELRSLLDELVGLVDQRRNRDSQKRAHQSDTDQADDQDGEAAPHVVPGQPGHGRFQADGDEGSRHQNQEFLLQGHDGGSQGDGTEATEGKGETDPHQTMPTHRLPRHAERLLVADLRRELLRLFIEQQFVGLQRRLVGLVRRGIGGVAGLLGAIPGPFSSLAGMLSPALGLRGLVAGVRGVISGFFGFSGCMKRCLEEFGLLASTVLLRAGRGITVGGVGHRAAPHI